MLSFEAVKVIMKARSNGRQISDKAVVQMSVYVEGYVRNVNSTGFKVF